MAMQELQDSPFDACMTRALRTDTTVSLESMQRARETLRVKAAQQTMLPPVSPSLSARLWKRIGASGREHLISTYNFLANDSMYHRVQHYYPVLMRYSHSNRASTSIEFLIFA